MKDIKFIGKNLRLARTFHGLSVKELSEKVGCSMHTIHQLELELVKPKKEFINVLSDALEVFPSFFSRPIDNKVTEEDFNH